MRARLTLNADCVSRFGPIVFGGGNWTENPYKVMAPLARAPETSAVIAVTPLSYIELNAKPSGGVESVDLSVISVGNADLTYTVSVVADGTAEELQKRLPYHNSVTVQVPADAFQSAQSALDCSATSPPCDSAVLQPAGCPPGPSWQTKQDTPLVPPW